MSFTKEDSERLKRIEEMLVPLFEKEKKSLRLKSYKGRMKGSRGDLMHRIISTIKKGGSIGVLQATLTKKLSYHGDSTAIRGIIKELIENKIVERNGNMWVSCEVIKHEKSPESGSLDWLADFKKKNF